MCILRESECSRKDQLIAWTEPLIVKSLVKYQTIISSNLCYELVDTKDPKRANFTLKCSKSNSYCITHVPPKKSPNTPTRVGSVGMVYALCITQLRFESRVSYSGLKLKVLHDVGGGSN